MRVVAWTWALAAVIGGCGIAKPHVFVDLSRVPREESPVVAVAPSPPPPLPGFSEELAPRAERRVTLGTSAALKRSVEERLRDDRARAVGAMTAQRTRSFRLAQERWTRTEMAALDALQNELTDDAFARIRLIFEAQADPVGLLRFELTALVGFPDPDPDSAAVPPPNHPPEARRLARAAAIRSQLRVLASQFRNDASSVLLEVASVVGARRSAMLAQLVERRDTLEQALAREAAAILARGDIATVAPEVEREASVPAAEGRHVEGSAPPPTDLAWTPAAPKDVQDQRLRHDLRIWAAQQGVVPTGRRGARDATNEFIEWRKNFRSAR